MTATPVRRLTRAQAAQEKAEAQRYLRQLFPPGSTAYTILRRVSRSGMMRHISVLAKTDDGIADATWAVARACGMRFDRDTGGVKVGGCGMDMGFHVVYQMSHTLYPNGHDCIEDRLGPPAQRRQCPSNDHSNYRGADCPTHHQDGGYAIRQRWL